MVDVGALEGERAVDACISVARSYHRTDTAARVASIRTLLKQLGEVMTNVRFSNADPAKQINEARNGFDSGSAGCEVVL